MLPKVMQVGHPVLHFGDMFAGGCVENVTHIVGAGGMDKAVEAGICHARFPQSRQSTVAVALECICVFKND